MQALRGDVKSSWDGQVKAIAGVLELNQAAISASIDKIDAEALQASAARSVQAVRKLESTVGLLQKILLEAGERPGNDYAPEEYAPEENPRFGTPPSGFSVSSVTALDEEAEREQQEQFESQADEG